MNIPSIKSLVVIMLCTLTLQGQSIFKESGHLKASDALHKESVYIHHNTSLLLAGEQLYYTLYCVDRATNLKSTLSKIAYVELMGADGIRIFRHKIKLNLGIGQGEFFIPTSVPTGNYKLLGYTQWMKNENSDYFFNSDINIVNPFQKNRDLILEKETSVLVDSIILREVNNGNTGSEPRFEGIKILMNRTTFGKREKVQLTLKNLINESGFGRYSISIRKKNVITAPNMIGANRFLRESKGKLNEKPINDSIYLPELRGEIIYGKVVTKITNSLVGNVKVVLSIPGKDHVVKISKTNEDGMFYFNLDKTKDQSNAFVQILGVQGDKNKIIMGNNQPLSFTGMTFNRLQFTPKMAQLLVDRSVHNQIENAYLDFKQDTLSPILNKKQFYQKYDHEYDLDDYTRFATIKEVMLEVVDNVWIAKNQEGKRTFHIRGYDNIPGIKTEPMVLVDGLLLQNHEDIMDIDARKVKKISLSRNKFRMGSMTYIGILAFETINGTFPSTYQNKDILTYKMFNPLRKKLYFKQRYIKDSSEDIDLLPDYRYQLLWIPTYELNENSKSIDFYTSDVNGNFEIRVEGITNDGQPVSLKANLIVE